MLYQFLLNFVDIFGFLNVFKYITFRTGLSLFTSLIIVLLIGGPFINFFSNRKFVNPIRDDGPQDHIIKKIGTPTMGGVIILFGLLFSVLCWGDLSNTSVLFCTYIAISFGVLGAFDDYKKIKQNINWSKHIFDRIELINSRNSIKPIIDIGDITEKMNEFVQLLGLIKEYKSTTDKSVSISKPDAHSHNETIKSLTVDLTKYKFIYPKQDCLTIQENHQDVPVTYRGTVIDDEPESKK